MSIRVNRRQFIIGSASATVIAALALSDFLEGKDMASSQDNQQPGAAPDGTTNPTNDAPVSEKISCDYVLRQGTIVDGSGGQPYQGDVAIKGDAIAAVGTFDIMPGAVEIDARGMVICPGFIDVHAHTESYLGAGGKTSMFLLQGITTHLGGNCGSSVKNVDEFFKSIKGMGINLGILSGYKNLRQRSMTSLNRKARASEIVKMQQYLAKDLKAGAFGMSVGLEYWPQTFSTTAELIEICQVLKEHNGVYFTHVRNEYDRVLQAVEEAITIGMTAGVPVEYSHIKAGRMQNWGKMSKILALIDQAAGNGLDITGDVYGYNFSGPDMDYGICSIGEDDIKLALQHPRVMIGSDSGMTIGQKPTHPRTYGNYPRIIRKYCLTEKVIPLETTIKKMTQMPAARLGLKDRGSLTPGYKADVVVFDLAKITDRSTRTNRTLLAEGVNWVFVNGKMALKEGKATGCLAGQILRKNEVIGKA